MTRRCPNCHEPLYRDDEPSSLEMLLFCLAFFGGGWLFLVWLVNG